MKKTHREQTNQNEEQISELCLQTLNSVYNDCRFMLATTIHRPNDDPHVFVYIAEQIYLLVVLLYIYCCYCIFFQFCWNHKSVEIEVKQRNVMIVPIT